MNLLTELREGIKVALAAVWANKLRAALTTLGIVIGVLTVTLMSMAIEGVNQAFLGSISAIGSDVLFIQKRAWMSDDPWWKTRNRRDILLRDAKAFAQQTTQARAVDIQAHAHRTVRYENLSSEGVEVVGGSEASAVVNGLTITEGRFLTASEVEGARPACVLGASVARQFFPFGGAVGKKVKIDGRAFEVVGTLDKMGEFLGMINLDNRVVVPITRLLTDLTWRTDVTIVVKVRDQAKMEDAREEMRWIMRKIRKLEPGAPDDFAINQQDTLIKRFEEISRIIALVGLSITGLSLFVGGIGIMNIMFVSVAERTHEIGLRKAIGARRRTILLQFLLEAAFICLLGGLMALAVAWPLSQIMARWLPATLSWQVAGMALGVSLVTGLISGFMPAWRAARLDPVEALRHE